MSNGESTASVPEQTVVDGFRIYTGQTSEDSSGRREFWWSARRCQEKERTIPVGVGESKRH